MAERFRHEVSSARVLFGAGRISEASSETARLGNRPLLIIDAAAAEVAAAPGTATLIRDAVEMIRAVRQHVPLADAEAARGKARAVRADVIVAVGGGSTIGLAKAVAMTERLPILAVPTTYAGSENTPVWGVTNGHEKTTGRDLGVAPKTVIYDPLLTVSLPPAITAASGLNALAHCVDALWAQNRTPLTDTMAERGMVSLAAGLPVAVQDPHNIQAREQVLIGAWLAGATFAAAGSSLHHKLCHALGGRYDLPHAQTHAAMLPWTTAFAIRQNPATAATIARALGADDPVQGLIGLIAATGAPPSLAALKLDEHRAAALADELDIDAMDLAFPVSRIQIRRLLVDATRGENSRYPGD